MERRTIAPRKVLIVANPTSGRGRGQRWMEAATELLRSRGTEVDAHLTRAAGDAERVVREIESDEVWVIGGDGTINEALQSLGGLERPLVVLPAGTGNVVARELGIPRRFEEALRIAVDGETRAVDLGRIEGRRFLFMLSKGLDAEVVCAMHRRRTGKTMHLWDYVPTVWACRKLEEERFQLIVDGEAIGGACWAGIFNVQRYGGLFRACPSASIDSGSLALLALRDPLNPRLLRVLRAMRRGRLDQLPDGLLRSFQHLRLVGPGRLQLDGDPFEPPRSAAGPGPGQEPESVEVEVEAARLLLRMPRLRRS